MAAEIVIGAAVSQAYNTLLKQATLAASKVVFCKKHCKKLVEDLNFYHSFFKEIFQHISECQSASAPSPAREWEQTVLDFKKKLENGRLLVDQCLQHSGFHPIQRYRLSNSIIRLRGEIRRHVEILSAITGLLQLQLPQATIVKGDEEDQEELHKLTVSIVDPMKEVMMRLVKESGDKNTALLMDAMRHIQATHIHHKAGSSPLIQQTAWIPGSQPLLPDFLVGLESSINQVKSLLFSAGDDKLVAIVGGMGGIGKTTLALALCRDPQVQDFFEQRIHFITVSQSPNMMGLLSTIWLRVTGEQAPPFHNLEDAYKQLQCRLSDYMQQCSSKCLLVLDDVWSKTDLENLSFQIDKRFKTLVTTRQAGMLETSKSQTYTLGFLSEENARRLFCHWTFGEEKIPSWAEEKLVKEVISECKGLPLALKVIGGSLFSEARIPQAWKKTRDKLRRAEPLDEDHKNRLHKRLQTSIDALDHELRDCFLDLGAFPEDSQSSVDNLLDMWVYVRGMDWDYAYLTLIELATRCLLSFDIHRFGEAQDPANDYGCAGSLVFTQHDVMRDLALQLGRDLAAQCRWLLMPQREETFPTKWQYTTCLSAQIVSISTGAMMQQDWPALEFPCAEALLLYSDGETYELPAFVRSMLKLKVFILRQSPTGDFKIAGSLRGLSHLQSIDIRTGKLIAEPDPLVSGSRHYNMPQLKKVQIRVMNDGFSMLLGGQILPSIEVMKFESNKKLKELPTECFQLRGLRVLYLQGCMSLRMLPEEIGTLSELRCVILLYCQDLEELPASLCNLKNLEVLQLDDCIRITKLPHNIGQLTALKKLLVVASRKLSSLPDMLSEMRSLEVLDLSNCNSLNRLPENIWQLPNLKILKMLNCLSLQELPGDFGLSSSIRELSLTNCSMLEHLPQGFGSTFNELNTMSLKGCYELRILPDNFGLCYNLRELDLSKCSELEVLPDNFTKLLCLEILNLSDCEKLMHLPSDMGQLRSLKQLHLSGSGMVEALPESLGELLHLQVLNFSGCDKLTHLPSNIGQLQCLKQLDLSGACNLEALPESFGELRCLEDLRLKGCVKLMHFPSNFQQLINELKRWDFIGVDQLESLPQFN